MPFLTLKNRDSVVFRLVSDKKKEDYSVFDIKQHVFLRGETIVESNDYRKIPVKETQFIAHDEFSGNFPDLRKCKRILREVIFEGEDHTFPMPVTVDRELEKIMATVRATGKDPLTVSYKVIKHGTGIATRYLVELADRPVEVAIEEGKEIPEQIQLSETEQKLVHAIKERGSGFSFEQIKANFVSYEVPEDRAKQIYEVYLK